MGPIQSYQTAMSDKAMATTGGLIPSIIVIEVCNEMRCEKLE